jgi:glycosyltransferase involved in cell wall biosynthesis
MLFSVIIPVRDDPPNLRRCLRSLAGQDLSDCEVLVCDDGSRVAVPVAVLREELPGVRLFRIEPSGPAVARNQLARVATGEYLFFLDADVETHPDTVWVARRILEQNPDLPAFFGSYDEAPADPAIVSSYKNLLHHSTHQASAGRVHSFWCGCGIIRRDTYLACGGLSESFTKPSIEDIELGMRLAQRGVAVECFPELQVKHLKSWRLGDWIYTDLFRRGIPWVREMSRTGRWTRDLNFSLRQRLACLAGGATVAGAAAAVFRPTWLLFAVAALVVFVVLNVRFFRLLWQNQGALRTLAMIPLHLIYAHVCIASLALGPIASAWPFQKVRGSRREGPPSEQS